MTTPRDLKQAVTIVTGAGSGVGAALCQQLAAAGATVVLIGRQADKLQQVQQTLSSPAIVLSGDVSDSEFCRQAIKQVRQEYGRLDVLFNNAGVMRRGTAMDTGDDEWALVMRVNVDGVFYMSRAAAGVMREDGKGGAIVNTASTCGLVGAAGLAAYCTSKGAVVQLTRTMALECAPHQITVNAVCPGAIEAPMLFSDHADGVSAAAVRQRNSEAIPLGKIASPDEVARAMIYLACEPHITGSMLSVDGGYTAG